MASFFEYFTTDLKLVALFGQAAEYLLLLVRQHQFLPKFYHFPSSE
jgi:hypothetical protein